MPRTTRPWVAASLALLALLLALPASAQVNLQVIHNAPDIVALGENAEVDVYVNGALTLDDFAFRTATPFLELPADTDLDVGVAPGDSEGAEDVVFSQTYNLPSGSYQLIASGLLAPDEYEANPDGIAIAFELIAATDAREASPSADQVSVRVVHGATDAPTVDVRSGEAVLVDDASYRDVTGYIDLAPDAYVLDVTTAGGQPVASFEADLGEAGGAALTVVASGFLTPVNDNSGPAFGLLAVFADGSTALLPAAVPDARVQIIHNAPDPAAAEVDVYVNGELALDDFAFRTATPFIDLPAGEEIELAVAPGTSSSAEDAVFSQGYILEPGATLRVVATGVLDPGGFSDNPDGISTAFQLVIAEGAESSATPQTVGLSVGHGTPDAPGVNVSAGGLTLVENLQYTEIMGYFDVLSAAYRVEVSTAGGMPIGAYTADLQGLAGGAVTVLASGFVSASDNQGGPSFALLAVLADGTTFLLPEAPSGVARVQIIHNAPDPAAAEVDVYVNGLLVLDDFAFRAATPFLDLPAETALTVSIAPGTSSDVGDAIFNDQFTLPDGSSTQLIASGVLDPGAFSDNPDGIGTAFQLLVGAAAREAADADEVAVRVVHGSPDAPTVDVRTDGAVLVDDASYLDATGYLEVAPAPYVLDVTTADGAPVASFEADLSLAGGIAATVLASGFLTPADDQDGPGLGLLAVFPNGSTLLLPVATASEGGPGAGVLTLGFPSPNPVASRARISFSLDAPGRASVAVYDALGRHVATLADGDFGAERVEVDLDATALAAGAYIVRLDAASGVRTRVVTVVR